MVKTKTINELQVKLLAFIAKINSAARGNNESIQWLSEESNYLFLKTDNYSNITPWSISVRILLKDTIKFFYDQF